MNNRPPAYNPYMYNIQPLGNMATAPPMDGFDQNYIVYSHEVNNTNLNQYPHKIENIPNHVYNPQVYATYPTYPPQIYIPPQQQLSYITTNDQYKREEIERRKRQDECCCFSILAVLCCCFVNI